MDGRSGLPATLDPDRDEALSLAARSRRGCRSGARVRCPVSVGAIGRRTVKEAAGDHAGASRKGVARRGATGVWAWHEAA